MRLQQFFKHVSPGYNQQPGILQILYIVVWFSLIFALSIISTLSVLILDLVYILQRIIKHITPPFPITALQNFNQIFSSADTAVRSWCISNNKILTVRCVLGFIAFQSFRRKTCGFHYFPIWTCPDISRLCQSRRRGPTNKTDCQSGHIQHLFLAASQNNGA